MLHAKKYCFQNVLQIHIDEHEEETLEELGFSSDKSKKNYLILKQKNCDQDQTGSDVGSVITVSNQLINCAFKLLTPA